LTAHQVRFAAPAREELAEASAFYQSKRPGYGERFEWAMSVASERG
jgi:hypothetical protein